MDLTRVCSYGPVALGAACRCGCGGSFPGKDNSEVAKCQMRLLADTELGRRWVPGRFNALVVPVSAFGPASLGEMSLCFLHHKN